MSFASDPYPDTERLTAVLVAQGSLDAAAGQTLVGYPVAASIRYADGTVESGVGPRASGSENVAPQVVTLLPTALVRSSGDGEPPRLTINSSVLPRVEVDADAIALSSSTGPRYALQCQLGRGGMGEVDLVEDRDIGRKVAMKRLLAEQSGLDGVARFIDEVRTVGQLEHPNIVPIHDVGIDEKGRFFFVMKYVDGETLETILDRLRAGDASYLQRFDKTRRVEIFQQILRALQFAHDRGIIHRDLKPANVMVGRFGEVVLMDWGVAGTIGSKERRPAGAGSGAAVSQGGDGDRIRVGRLSTTQAGALIGTPLYMSPEQARGENDSLDQRSDLYSAMLLFHEWIGFERLRPEQGSLVSVLIAAHSEPPPGVGRLFGQYRRLGVGAEYAHFVRKGLQLRPEARYQSAAEMLEDLHLILAGRFRVQCPITLSKRISLAIANQLDRNPLPLIAAVLLLALAGLGLVGYVVWDAIGAGAGVRR